MTAFYPMASLATSGEAGFLSQVLTYWVRWLTLGDESCCVAEVFESIVVGARSCLQWWRAGVVGEVRQAGG